jgi:hypothetical protein
MIITNPKKPVMTGIITALVISSLVVGVFYLYPYLSMVNINFRTEIQLPENVKNSFGTYELTELNYTPSIIPTPIQLGLANVDLQGLENELNAEIKQQLEDYGFALVDGGIEDIFLPMDKNVDMENPMYVTTDFCLHVLHSIFDNTLRIIELEYFYSNFSLMIDVLRSDQMDLHSITSDTELKTALQHNIAYLTVIMYLLDNTTSIPAYVDSLVSGELVNIENGVRATSLIFEYDEDYSQYKPRGHYTRNDEFKRYFKAMMYAGRMGFLITDKTEENVQGIKQTKMALALVYSFSADISENTVWDYWDSICRTTGFLVGGSDDLTPVDYFAVWEQLGLLEFSELADDNRIREAIEDLKELRNPKINSGYVDAFEGQESATKGFRLFGQSYTPDAYIFQELVYDNLPDRLFPQALDILSVFGSERAKYHLEDEKNYVGYEDKIVELREEFTNLTIEDWTQNVYWQWLYSLLPLLEEKTDGYPGFMQSEAWTDKSLVTSLSSWVELKHDTILYAKQSYIAYPSIPEQVYHYVEPYPRVYSRISATASMMKDGLLARGVLYENLTSESSYSDQIFSNFTFKFEELIEIFDTLTDISIKELENQELTSEELHFIQGVGTRLSDIASFNYNLADKYTSDADKRTALIADVFTEPYSGQVLEVAVGNPFLIYVIVQDDTGALKLTSQRLTDEEWQAMLDSSPPDMSSWITNNLPISVIETIPLQLAVLVAEQGKKTDY